MSKDAIKNRIRSIKNNLDELSEMKELYEAEQKLKEIEKKIKQTRDELDDDDDSNLKPLLKIEIGDLDIYEKRYKTQKLFWEKKRREEDLRSGKLTGADAIKAQREIGLDNVKEVDNQGLMIDSIEENIKTANINLTNINNELQNQGEQMNRIQEKTLETENQVKQTGKIMTKMEGRAKCIQILTFLSVILFGLLDVAMLIFGLVKKFGK